MVRLTFHGAAETVTGSKYLLEADGASLLVDCGLFQGLKALRLRNRDAPAFDVASLDAVLLTHAHIDHSGYLPRLVRRGYEKAIHCTPATEDLVELLLLDAARLQEEDAEHANRKGYSKHRPALPLFDSDDAVRTLNRIQAVRRGEWFEPARGIRARLRDAGHLLGSAMVEVEVSTAGRPLKLLFSGDVGRYDAPLYFDPSPPPDCDYLICESTYGDRDHPAGDVLDQLCELIWEGIRRGGVILVASFAVGRAQQLIYLLEVLIHDERLPELPIFLDSPMAVDATNIYRKHHAEHDLSEGQLAENHPALSGRNVHLARTVAESKQINDVSGPAVIISASGMMTGGRILHHLRRRLPEGRNTILLGGYMAAGTRGRKLQEGATSLRIHGRDVPVRAAVGELSGLSGHADRGDLLRWLSPLEAPRRVFVTHGEKPSAQALAEELRRRRGWETCVPHLGQSVELEA